MYKVILITVALVYTLQSFSQAEWKNLESVEQVCERYPDRISKLLDLLDLSNPALARVKKEFSGGNNIGACLALLDLLIEKKEVAFLRADLPQQTDRLSGAGDSILLDYHLYYNQLSKIPRTAKGHLDWNFRGPTGDIEWAWALNRHPHIRALLNSFLETGNQKYSAAIDRDLKDWVISSLPYPGVKSRTEIWRGLEASHRIKVWAKTFYSLNRAKLITPATQLLMLTSIPEHCDYLKKFHGKGNWLTMEMSALALAAVAWPEFEEAESWLRYSKQQMLQSMDEQIYPDGVQTELTAHYHYVALNNFNQFGQICREGGVRLPAGYFDQIESMWNYIAYSMRPSGTNPLNNDSDLRNYQKQISGAATEFDRKDWTYIATHGQTGTAPEQQSVFFPYAGQAIFRSSWNEDALWSFFDVGPWGSGHQHNDKLHLSVSAFGSDFLVDAGRFSYRGEVAEKYRPYARSTSGHNSILVDGQGQSPGPKVCSEAIDSNSFFIASDLSWARGSMDLFEELEGDFVHHRLVTLIDSKFWIVVDSYETDRMRKVQNLWHFHPGCGTQVRDGNIVDASRDGSTLQVVPITAQDWTIKRVEGQTEPRVQGWYSQEYNLFTPNPTYTYSASISDGDFAIWLLLPSIDASPVITWKIVKNNSSLIDLEIRISSDEYLIKIPVNDENGVTYEKK